MYMTRNMNPQGTHTNRTVLSSGQEIVNRVERMPLTPSTAPAHTNRSTIHLHDIFLNCCRKEHAAVEIVTKSGEIIDGIIDGYDREIIILHNDMAQMLIYKHAVNYICPSNSKHYIDAEGTRNKEE